MQRRRFLQIASATVALGATATSFGGASAFTVATKVSTESVMAGPITATPIISKSLSLHNLHTGERISNTAYNVDGKLSQEGYSKLNHITRDWRRNEVKELNPKLYDFLHMIQEELGEHVTFDVISGYRSPHTNATLRGKRKNSGVAKKSKHMVGDAIDIRVPGVKLSKLRDIAWKLQRGGVGYYPSSNFIHIDVGNVRKWGF